MASARLAGSYPGGRLITGLGSGLRAGGALSCSQAVVNHRATYSKDRALGLTVGHGSIGQRGAVVDIEAVDTWVGKDPVGVGVGSKINVDGGVLGSTPGVQGDRPGELGIVNILSVPAGPENTGLLGLWQAAELATGLAQEVQLGGHHLLLAGEAGIIAQAQHHVVQGALSSFAGDNPGLVFQRQLQCPTCQRCLDIDVPASEQVAAFELRGLALADVGQAAAIAAVLALVLGLFHKEIVAVSLDKESAKAAGLPVLALLVVPAASARLLCSTLGRMMVCAPAFGAVTPRWGFIFPGLSTCPPAASSC